MNSLVIGLGEVGTAVKKVFEKHHDVDGRDIEHINTDKQYQVLHICYRQSDDFVDITNAYIDEYQPLFTIIHTTTPVGTVRKVKGLKAHCPIRGRHEKLADGVESYPLFFSYDIYDEWIYVRRYMSETNLQYNGVRKYETTELCKLLELIQYGYNIEFYRYAKKCCDEFDVDIEHIQDFGKTYNKYIKVLESDDFMKPVLTPPEGPIGGHCVLPGMRILNAQVPDTALEQLLLKNKEK